MRAWQYKATTGGLEKNLVLETDLPSPELAPQLADSDVLVQVLSAGLNPVDYKLPEMGMVVRLMVPVPATPGLDFCGRVVKIGRTVDSLAVGETVFGRIHPTSKGTLAEFLVTKSAYCVPLPTGLSPDYGAAMGTTGCTAFDSIAPNVKSGDKIFINGGSGGTGTMGIQIAKALGCHVTVSCSTGKMALCKELGADEIIDYTKTNVTEKLKAAGQVFTLVIDNVGTSPEDLYQASTVYLVPGGKYIQIGAAPDLKSLKTITSRALLPSFLGGGSRSFQVFSAVTKKETLTQLAELMREGKLKPVIEETFEFEQVPAAFEKLKLGKSAGKIIVHVDSAEK